MIKKDEKVVRKPKGKKAQETQMLGSMPKSQEKVIAKTMKMANKKRAAKEKVKDIKSQTIDSDSRSLKP